MSLPGRPPSRRQRLPPVSLALPGAPSRDLCRLDLMAPRCPPRGQGSERGRPCNAIVRDLSRPAGRGDWKGTAAAHAVRARSGTSPLSPSDPLGRLGEQPAPAEVIPALLPVLLE